MLKQRRSQGGDPLFLIALIIILLMALAEQQSASGALGGAAKGIKAAFDAIFGGTPAKCVFLKQNIFGSSGIAGVGTTGSSTGMAADVEWNRFINSPMPPWQCYIFFGMLPFTILYYFMFDLMAFTFVSNRSKKIVALAVAMFAVVFGAFNGVAYLLTSITNWATGSIIFTLLILGIASAIIGQFGITMNMTTTAAASVGEAYYGLKTLQAIGKSVTKEGEK